MSGINFDHARQIQQTSERVSAEKTENSRSAWETAVKNYANESDVTIQGTENMYKEKYSASVKIKTISNLEKTTDKATQ